MHISHTPEIFDRMTALADTTRSRMLLVLERHELTVNELKSVLQLPQSTVSRHLKTLGDEGWVVSRPEGTSRQYRMTEKLEPSVRRLWHLVREQMISTSAAAQDSRRVQTVLAHRRTRSQKFFSSAAGQWDRLRSELFGARADIVGLLGLIDESWQVGDLGCGTGQLSEIIAPFAGRVIAVDDSAAMIGAARRRLAAFDNVTVRNGELEALPIEDESLDVALLFLVLHYVVEPELAIAEAHRVLKPGGRLIVVDMMPHDRQDLLDQMGHVWRGFSEEQVASLFETAGFPGGRYQPLPADESAKGPSLFTAVARRVRAAQSTELDADATGSPTPLALTA
ncbi:MAG TPA: metalloregulator ArsR/SmtB family transcription factor [Gemmatimonadaceae bacterium]|nr:metalloregulator ArsR/SmtB family transcription factor [Gemmatimonadaceae bacterium]